MQPGGQLGLPPQPGKPGMSKGKKIGLGVGGVWPNAVALAAECWPDKSRPIIAGLMGAALNGGILLLSQVARTWHITPESWRWIFWLAAAPAVPGDDCASARVTVDTWLLERAR
jgi:MFS family permease